MIKAKYHAWLCIITGAIIFSVGAFFLEVISVAILGIIIGSVFVGGGVVVRDFIKNGILDEDEKLHWWDYRREKKNKT
jgi:hypothetical protein